MLNRFLTILRMFSISVPTCALLATSVFAADPAPASPPTSGDPAPASPPTSRAADPAPASAPISVSPDPAPASPPGTSTDPVLLIDMPTIRAPIVNDPAPASPPSSVSSILPSVMDDSSAVSPSPPSKTGKAFLGVGFRDPSNTAVTTLWSNSTAAKLGIQLGDRIVAINGSPVGNLQQIRDILSTMAVGDDATITIARNEGSPVSIGPLALGVSHE